MNRTGRGGLAATVAVVLTLLLAASGCASDDGYDDCYQALAAPAQAIDKSGKSGGGSKSSGSKSSSKGSKSSKSTRTVHHHTDSHSDGDGDGCGRPAPSPTPTRVPLPAVSPGVKR
ncbi:hypothetical protein [Kitasatospora sp. NPDC088346]|uniref:hypothetical protein n=1 Tax=Kitasatospora sp. NPDC088346 TaxID=3364073 RepID=UPI003828F526